MKIVKPLSNVIGIKKGRSLDVGNWEFIGQLINEHRDNGYLFFPDL